MTVTENSIGSRVQSALASWLRTAQSQRYEDAEKLRGQFVAAFPINSWNNLPLDRYALGQHIEGTVCWWLEYGTRSLASMGGGTAKKHLIFRKSDGTWYYPSQYNTVEQAWQKIRAGFVEMLDMASKEMFDETDHVEALSTAAMLRAKVLYLYFPDQLLPILSKAHLDHFLRALGRPAPGLSPIRANRELLTTLRSIPGASGASTLQLMDFLYSWSDPSVRVVQIAAGDRSEDWDACLADRYACVGWDDVGDLTQFDSKVAFREAFREHYPYDGNEAQVARQSDALWKLMELHPGDKVVANRGVSEVLALGNVNDVGYRWRPERARNKHTLGIDWDTSKAQTVEPVRVWRTSVVSDVSASLYRKLIGKAAPGQTIDVDPVYVDVEEALERRGQVIVYGPPGTGKTYTARRAAVWLLEGADASTVAAETLTSPGAFDVREQQLSTGRSLSHQVWFVVANPAHWAWRALLQTGSVKFALGRLQRNYPDVRAGDLVVGYESTPTKRVVALARVISEYDPESPPESALELEPITSVKDGVTYDELQKDAVLSASEPARFRCQGTLFKLAATEADRILALLAERDPKIGSFAEPSVQRLTRITFHPSYTYEDFIEGFRPTPTGSGTLELVLTDGIFKRVCKAAVADPDRRYVLLIDEINRGNIPKIFGELITLIEGDKRGLTVRLPQSGDEFAVPPNLLIIGTMNTADRSIHLLDTALRRRFSFIELLPDSQVLTGSTAGPLALDLFLESLNDRIRQQVGREKQVGHAMFFDNNGEVIDTAEDFTAVFRHELLPLLQEYLYEDYKQLGALLGPVIDTEAERLSPMVGDPETLCAALAEQFNARASG